MASMFEMVPHAIPMFAFGTSLHHSRICAGSFDAPFIEAGAWRRTGARARASRQKIIRYRRVVNQVFALVRRTGTKCEHRHSARQELGIDRGIARVDRLDPERRRELVRRH